MGNEPQTSPLKPFEILTRNAAALLGLPPVVQLPVAAEGLREVGGKAVAAVQQTALSLPRDPVAAVDALKNQIEQALPNLGSMWGQLTTTVSSSLSPEAISSLTHNLNTGLRRTVGEAMAGVAAVAQPLLQGKNLSQEFQNACSSFLDSAAAFGAKLSDLKNPLEALQVDAKDLKSSLEGLKKLAENPAAQFVLGLLDLDCLVNAGLALTEGDFGAALGSVGMWCAFKALDVATGGASLVARKGAQVLLKGGVKELLEQSSKELITAAAKDIGGEVNKVIAKNIGTKEGVELVEHLFATTLEGVAKKAPEQVSKEVKEVFEKRIFHGLIDGSGNATEQLAKMVDDVIEKRFGKEFIDNSKHSKEALEFLEKNREQLRDQILKETLDEVRGHLASRGLTEESFVAAVKKRGVSEAQAQELGAAFRKGQDEAFETLSKAISKSIDDAFDNVVSRRTDNEEEEEESSAQPDGVAGSKTSGVELPVPPSPRRPVGSNRPTGASPSGSARIGLTAGYHVKARRVAGGTGQPGSEGGQPIPSSSDVAESFTQNNDEAL